MKEQIQKALREQTAIKTKPAAPIKRAVETDQAHKPAKAGSNASKAGKKE